MSKIKIGVFGVGRGMDIAENFLMLDCDIVAVCENNAERLEKAKEKLDKSVAVYDNFDAFIEHDMDAMIIANFFHEHAPYAIKCFEKGIHVFCECISNGTMAEGVELVRAFEKSNSIFMLAENYPQMIFNREMKRVCDEGTLGKIVYAEGEYNHPFNPHDAKFNKTYVYAANHWRNYLPATYYITHSLGPIMWSTGATPKRVTAFTSFAAEQDENVPVLTNNADKVGIVTTQNDDGSIFRVTGCAAFGGHHNAYRICGTNGQIENLRGMGSKIMLRYNKWQVPEGKETVNCYDPQWNDKDEELIELSGHGGGDYLTARTFVDCIKAGKQPEHPFDIYSATVMSSVAILAHRSALSGGQPFDIPDFREEKWREMYENDRDIPFYSEDRAPTIPCCSQPEYAPTEKQKKLFFDMLESKE
jgi:predicted dehydrogenase